MRREELQSDAVMKDFLRLQAAHEVRVQHLLRRQSLNLSEGGFPFSAVYFP